MIHFLLTDYWILIKKMHSIFLIKIVIYKNSDFPVEFNNGLAFVSYDGIISYIDKTGKIVWSDSL